MRFSALLALAACSGGPSRAAPEGPFGGAFGGPFGGPFVRARGLRDPHQLRRDVDPPRRAPRPDPTDSTAGVVTWDGSCVDAGTSSYAVLSNGWRPYFAGQTCAVALDHPDCSVAAASTTRITYGAAWLPPSSHPDAFDDVAGVLGRRLRGLGRRSV